MPVSLLSFATVDLAPVQLGPVVLAGERLLAVITIAAALTVAEVWARRNDTRSDAAWAATWIGWSAARLGFVAADPASFAERPWEIAYVWQGGFVAWIGVLAAVTFASASALRAGGFAELRARGVPAAVLAGAVAGALALAVLPVLPAAPPVTSWPPVTRIVDGAAVDPSTWQGSPTIVNVFATWCPPCRRELPMLMAWAEEARAGELDLAVAIVSQGERAETVEAYLVDNGWPGSDVFVDPSGRLGDLLGVVGLPTTFVLDRSGNVVGTLFGETSRARLEAVLRTLGP